MSGLVSADQEAEPALQSDPSASSSPQAKTVVTDSSHLTAEKVLLDAHPLRCSARLLFLQSHHQYLRSPPHRHLKYALAHRPPFLLHSQLILYMSVCFSSSNAPAFAVWSQWGKV